MTYYHVEVNTHYGWHLTATFDSEQEAQEYINQRINDPALHKLFRERAADPNHTRIKTVKEKN